MALYRSKFTNLVYIKCFNPIIQWAHFNDHKVTEAWFDFIGTFICYNRGIWRLELRNLKARLREKRRNQLKANQGRILK